uniref:C-type lectin domain-containing protein n=1 Tax=Acrobeloides nanus TaxID=290746 RepID=A0A914DPX6_9BILA
MHSFGYKQQEIADALHISQQLLPEWYDWNTTRTYCLQYGADLPIIRNQAENNAIKKLAIFNEWDHFFLGLMNVNLDGNWVWIQDGSLANYTNWVPSQPDINNVIAGYYSTDEIECCSAGQWYSFALDDMIPGLCAMHAF